MPEKATTNRREHGKDQQFSPANPLRATLSVIPGQDERDKEPDAERDDDEAHRLFGPAKSLRDNVDALEEREGGRHIGHRPLHQLTLFQMFEEVVHRFNSAARGGTFMAGAGGQGRPDSASLALKLGVASRSKGAPPR